MRISGLASVQSCFCVPHSELTPTSAPNGERKNTTGLKPTPRFSWSITYGRRRRILPQVRQKRARKAVAPKVRRRRVDGENISDTESWFITTTSYRRCKPSPGACCSFILHPRVLQRPDACH